MLRPLAPAPRLLALGFGLALALPAAAQIAPATGPVNDYPTEARAEYVFACMAVNGRTQEVLQRCSCSIDQVATILPYDRYVEAETVLRMRQGGGEAGALFRGAPAMRDIAAELRRAQAEAEMLCF